jgi:hypothetical protein
MGWRARGLGKQNVKGLSRSAAGRRCFCGAANGQVNRLTIDKALHARPIVARHPPLPTHHASPRAKHQTQDTTRRPPAANATATTAAALSTTRLDQLCDGADAAPRELRQQDHALDAVVFQQGHVRAHLCYRLDLAAEGGGRGRDGKQASVVSSESSGREQAQRRGGAALRGLVLASGQLQCLLKVLKASNIVPKSSTGGPLALDPQPPLSDLQQSCPLTCT